MQNLRVYIADDSAPVRERLAGRLAEIEGVELVGQSGNAIQAIEEIRRLRPDVAILDIRLPGGNGIQVLTAVKQGAAPPVVIMLTAFAYPQYRTRCQAAGADYFFDKTTEYDDVFKVLEQLQRARANGETARAVGSADPCAVPGATKEPTEVEK
jgi:DNA-binding NarL/FixJ family response regulator